MIMDDSCHQNLILHVCQLSYFQPNLMGNTSKYMSINKAAILDYWCPYSTSELIDVNLHAALHISLERLLH